MKDNRRLEKSLLLDGVMRKITIKEERYAGAIRAEISDQIDKDLQSGKSLEQIAEEMGVELIPLAFGDMPKKQLVDKSKAGREIPDQTADEAEDMDKLITQVSFLVDESREDTQVLFDFDFSEVTGITTKEISRSDIRFIMRLYNFVRWNKKKISQDKKYIAVSANKMYAMMGYKAESGKLNAGQYEAMLKRYKRLNSTYISFDLTGQFIHKYGAVPPKNLALLNSTNLLCPLNVLEWKDRSGNKTLAQWYALPVSEEEVSPLANYINNTLTNGGLLVENKYLTLPGRYSDEKQAMLEYIICQIKLYQKRQRNDNSILYDTLFKNCGINPQNGKARFKFISYVSEILEHLKNTGLITAYKEKITKPVPGQRGVAPAYKFSFETERPEKASKKKPAKP